MNEYYEKLFTDIDNLKNGLKYLIKRNAELENENKYLREAYENRVNECINLNKIGGERR